MTDNNGSNQEPKKEFYTTKELCELLRVCRWTIQRYREQLGLPHLSLGRKIQYPRKLIEEWIENQTIGSTR